MSSALTHTTRFKSLVDMIEDVMQGSLPSFIYSVRVSDMSQGSNPFRITSIRSLPDADIDDALVDLPQEDRDRLQGKHIVSVVPPSPLSVF